MKLQNTHVALHCVLFDSVQVFCVLDGSIVDFEIAVFVLVYMAVNTRPVLNMHMHARTHARFHSYAGYTNW